MCGMDRLGVLARKSDKERYYKLDLYTASRYKEVFDGSLCED